MVDLDQDVIYAYASLYLGNSFFIIGGGKRGGEPVSVIGRLDSTSWSWSPAGNLKIGRTGHNVIESNSRLLVVGGKIKPKVSRRNPSFRHW